MMFLLSPRIFAVEINSQRVLAHIHFFEARCFFIGN